MESGEGAAKRKDEHISICASGSVDAGVDSFSQWELRPTALPELAMSEVSTEQRFLGRVFALPVMIAGMTGGVEKGQEINEALAIAAAEFGIPMGLGSQKLMVQDASLRRCFDVRKVAPKIFLIGNLGAADIAHDISLDEVRRLVSDSQLDAMAIHLNCLQEAIQPEGSTNFTDVIGTIEKLVLALSVPVVVKEVGAGISGEDCRRLRDAGVAAIDVGGKGGTSWARVEGQRGLELERRLGDLFADWGISTAESLVQCGAALGTGARVPELIATGGIRNGLQVAKAVALGASMCGVGLPLFRRVLQPQSGRSPVESVLEELRFFARSFRIAMFCTGAANVNDLRGRIDRRRIL